VGSFLDAALIRNFSIIAHIDHGKSTLADRILDFTGVLSEREKQDQFLDKMDLERERGITIKLQSVRLPYRAQDGQQYILNLIDTPGHVDFSYEVSRSLQACEGALLVVDAAQGIEAQTLANLYLALENNLTIIPVINKIDLPSADPERVKHELKKIKGLDKCEPICASAKTGEGINEILEQIVVKVPAPTGKETAPLRALIFDSLYDPYKGVIIYLRVVDGLLQKGMRIRLFATKKEFDVLEVGTYAPHASAQETLSAGEVGYLIANIKSVQDTRVGDTVVEALNLPAKPLPGYRPITPMVFCGLYPIDSALYEDLREALQKLLLNDASLVYEPETSTALGFGFRCGFLGLLHMEIIQERIEREFKIALITTAPSVIYKVLKTNGEVQEIDNPHLLPPREHIDAIEEPYTKITIMLPNQFIGAVMKLCQDKRGEYVDLKYLEDKRVQLVYNIPLAEIICDFFDRLKSQTKGYASLDYELSAYQASALVKLDILLNGTAVDALSFIVHKDRAYQKGKALVEKLKTLIPRQMFEVPIQAAIGNKVIARETISAIRKNVLAKCYGGDISRKRKLLEKQKEGKKRMKSVGNVEVPQEAFMAVLKIDD
jgi:GTP-binding protein LepA